MKRLAMWLALGGLRGLSVSAQAACSVGTTTPAAFGLVGSMAVKNTLQSTSTLNSGLSCVGTGITLFGTSMFKATITSATSGMVGPTGDVIGYTIYATHATTYPISRGAPGFDFASNGLLSLLGLIGSASPKYIPLYISTITGSNVAAGVYTETLNIQWDWYYCPGIGIGGICIGANAGSKSTALTVTLTVANDCTISALNISFGSAPVISAFTPVTSQTISLSCTKGSAYTVGLSDGAHALSVGGRRQMISGSNFLAYDIFKSAGTTRWGRVGSARRASSDAEINPGNGLGVGSQVFNFNAKIYTDQATPPAGTYIDNVVLDVGF